MRNLLDKYREIITYIVCGVVTTLVNYAAYFLLTGPAGLHYAAANVVAWMLSVIAAYVMNKAIVFRASDWTARTVAREFSQMAGARLATLGLETAILWLAIDVAGLGAARISIMEASLSGEAIAKLAAGAAVTVTNYFISKLWVFKKSNKRK